MQRFNINSFLILTVLLFSVESVGAICMRCTNSNGSELLCENENKADAISKCGGPSYREEVGTQMKGSFRSKAETTKLNLITTKTKTRGHYKEDTAYVEKWYYNCGEGEFNKILTFKGGGTANY